MAFNFDIPSLRRNALMTDWGQPPPQDTGGGYDWSAPMVDYSAGEMPEYNAPAPPMLESNPINFGAPATAPMGPQSTPFASQGAPPPIAPPAVKTYDSGPSTMDTVNRMFTPDFTDRDRLRSLMDAAPERGPVGWGRGLSAIALGIGSKSPEEGLKAQEAVMFAPHRREMADWTARTEPFLKTAELENRQNINERTLTSNVVTAETAARRLEENARQADQKNEIALEKNRVARLRAEIAGRDEYEVSARGPTIIVTNKNTGVPTDTGIKTGWMSEADKIEAEGKWGVKRSEASGVASVQRARAAQGILTDETGKKWRQNIETGNLEEDTGAPPGVLTKPGTPPRAGAGGGELEKDRVEQNTLQGMFEQSDPNVIRGTNGKFELKKRPKLRDDTSWMPGDQSVTQAQLDAWDASKRRVDPTYVPPKSVSAPPPPAAAKPAAPAASTPRKRVTAGEPINPPAGSASDFLPPLNIPVPKFSGKGLGPQNVPKVAAPTVSKGRITIYKNGKPAGTISDTPEAIQDVIRRGYDIGA